MFEEALEGLLLQKENMVPATATSRTVEGGGKDGVQSPCDGIGWVEVVRRVSDIAVSFGFCPEDLPMIQEKVKYCSSQVIERKINERLCLHNTWDGQHLNSGRQLLQREDLKSPRPITCSRHCLTSL